MKGILAGLTRRGSCVRSAADSGLGVVLFVRYLRYLPRLATGPDPALDTSLGMALIDRTVSVSIPCHLHYPLPHSVHLLNLSWDPAVRTVFTVSLQPVGERSLDAGAEPLAIAAGYSRAGQ